MKNCEAFPQSQSGRRGGFDPWVGNTPWRRKWQPNQYSCLENPVGAGAWWAAAPGVTDSDTAEHACVLSHEVEIPRADTEPALPPTAMTHLAGG